MLVSLPNPPPSLPLQLFGRNFGPANDLPCVFLQWQGSPAGSVRKCDGWESFLGEGETYDKDVHAMNHTFISFTVFPGVSHRVIPAKYVFTGYLPYRKSNLVFGFTFPAQNFF